jgi:hypothetical protein
MPCVHVFKGALENYGFTADPNGSNLPAEKGPWHKVRDTEMNRGDGPRFGVSTDDILDAFERGEAHVASDRRPPNKSV